MKKLIIVFLLLSVYLAAKTQVPGSFNYQAVVRDESGNPLSEQNIGIQISIIKNDVFGASAYVETFDTQSNKYGLISLQIGTGSVVYGQLSEIEWGDGPYFIKIGVDKNGGSSYVEMGTSQLLSVPYALHAKTAENSFSGNYSDLEGKPEFTGWDTDNTDDFDGNYSSLTGAPSRLSEFSNDPGYLTSADFINWDKDVSDDFGGDFADLKNVPEDISDGDDVLSEDEVDEYVSDNGYLTTEEDGSRENEIQDLSQVLSKGSDAGDQIIRNLGEPQSNKDAVTKEYVDRLLQRIETLERQNENSYSADTGRFVDYRDDHEYKWVRIGEQIWMAENLAYLPAFKDYPTQHCKYYVYDYFGDSIEEAKETENYRNYGVLYNAEATKESCPNGWHISGWRELINYLDYINGGLESSYSSPFPHDFSQLTFSNIGTKLKSTTGWSEFNNIDWNGTDNYFFNVLPAGYFDQDDSDFKGLGSVAKFWGSLSWNPAGDIGGWEVISIGDYVSFFQTGQLWYLKGSFPIRCVKD